MDVEIKRDGIILRGKIEKPYNTNNKKISDKYPALIIFHGFAGDLGYDETAYSQGVVVKAEKDSDYYIVMECSSKNKGYRHAQVILTMGGCM